MKNTIKIEVDLPLATDAPGWLKRKVKKSLDARRRKYVHLTPERINQSWKLHLLSVPVREICQRIGFSKTTFYKSLELARILYADGIQDKVNQ